MSKIKELSDWIEIQCAADEDWKHDSKIEIRTLDNPGWAIKILLPYEKELRLIPMHIDNGDEDWAFSKVENGAYFGYGDLSKLDSLIDNFLSSIELSL
ncbi:MAG: Imm53 family immunity protein [Saprospiraceae bacterium]